MPSTAASPADVPSPKASKTPVIAFAMGEISPCPNETVALDMSSSGI